MSNLQRDYHLEPIQTHYSGVQFRSLLEARWALFFDLCGLEWVYEPRRFMFTNKGGRFGYIPDFFLPELDMWAEVKPDEFTSTELRKARAVACHTSQCILLLSGQPGDTHWDVDDGETEDYFAFESYSLVSITDAAHLANLPWEVAQEGTARFL